MGIAPNNIMLCDTKGVIYRGRNEGMNQWKSAHAVETGPHPGRGARRRRRRLRPLRQGRLHARHDPVHGARSRSSSRWQTPTPRSRPRRWRRSAPTPSWRPGARTIRTRSTTCSASPTSSAARSTCGARQINMEMKIAAAQALAELAREDVPDEVAAAYRARGRASGRDYIIPVPFDPRLIHTVPPAVAKAAMDTGVARKPIEDMRAYKAQLSARRDPVAGTLQLDLRARAQVPEARRLRRGRGAAGHPRRELLRQPGPRHGDPGRPRGPGAADRRGRRHRSRRPRRARDPQRPAFAPQQRVRPVPVRAAAAARLPAPRLPAHDQPGPQPFRRLDGGARRRRRHGDGRDAQLLDRAERHPQRHRREARPPRHRHLDLPRRGRTVLVADTAITEMPGGAGASPRSRSRRRASRAGSATSRGSRCLPTRPSASRRASAPRRSRRRCASSTACGSISSTTATSRPTWR